MTFTSGNINKLQYYKFLVGFFTGVDVGRSKTRYQKPWDSGGPYYEWRSRSEPREARSADLLASLGIETEKLEPEVRESLFSKPAEALEADITFILRRGLRGRGPKGRQRLVSMLSDQNVISGLLRWNGANSKSNRPASDAKFPKGLIDK